MGARLCRLAAVVVGALLLVPVLVVGSAAEAAGRVAPEPAAAAVLSSAANGAVGPVAAGQHPPLAVDPPASGTVPAGGWAWPLHPKPTVLARFDPPEVAWASGHRGVDLAASVGQEVLAPLAGTVSFAGVVVDRAVVVVTTASGLRATFEPVEATVPAGTTVARGQVIGHVTDAPGHCAPLVCVHWGVLRGETYLDPFAFIGPRRVILLPLNPP